ncbi:(2Fe-2S) ferredoxin domain-containing protein [bacterium CPR1]|nr:(2Fe-2S) ferredoxin domain-containing protein [bacterium CPR1]
MSQTILEGSILGFCPALNEEEPASFWLKTLTVVEHIQLPPGLHQSFEPGLTRGRRVRVFVDENAGQLVARLIFPLVEGALSVPETGRIGKVQVCMHKNCCQNGARELKNALQDALSRHPQGEQIVLEAVGCMDHCKRGPNVRILPANRVYHRMTPIGVIALLHRSFPQRAPVTSWLSWSAS